MSAARGYQTAPDSNSNSPAKPGESEYDSDMPEEGAVCSTLSDDSSCDSLWRASRSHGNQCLVDPKDFITDEMLDEEKRLCAKGEEEEKKSTEAQNLTDEIREKNYQRLLCLLNKSMMYSEYLVGRIKRQKEEEEMRRERLLKRKLKTEQERQNREDREHTESVDKVSGGLEDKPEDEEETQNVDSRSTGEEDRTRKSCRTREASKRRIDEKDRSEIPQQSVAKRQKRSTSIASSPSADSRVLENEKDLEKSSETANLGQSSKEQDGQGNVANKAVEEPELIEKAKTFGVIEEEGEEPRVINGETVPFLQPKLMDGGVLRPYQVEGYSWLKVLYENGVNGILADEMGLGKTVQCVAVLSHLVYMGIPGPFLICAPLSTIPNWHAEFKRFAPKVPTVLYHGQKGKRVHLVKRIRRRYPIREGVSVQPVVITSYEIAMIDRRFLAGHDWKYLIVDEGHRIKNTHCRLIRELRMYRSTHRLLLTGTPLQNSLAELWSLLNFLVPEIFDDLGSFEAWFDASCINDEDAEEKILQQEKAKNILSMLHQILSPFMLRRLKSDVDLNIPPKKEILVFAPVTQQQKDFYSALVDKTIFNFINQKTNSEDKTETVESGRPKRRSASVKVDYSLLMETDADKNSNKNFGARSSRRRWKDVEQEERELESWVQAVCDRDCQNRPSQDKKQRSSQVTIKMRNVMMQLRKCCNHPYLLEHPLDPKTGDLALTDGVISASGKMLVLDKMLAELKKRGHRVLIFSQMTRMLDLIEDFCYIRKYDFCRLDGSTDIDDRRDSMDVFNTVNSDKFLFLLSTRAGGLGINLTGADTVIIYDSDWNPQCDLQAQDRCHRIGQRKPVVVYRLVTANTIDQKIIERAAAKRKLEKMIIHKGKFKSGNFLAKAKPFSPEELRDLLQSKDHDSEVKGETFAITKAEMNILLDRSDLLEKWNMTKQSTQDEVSKEAEMVNKSVPVKTKSGKSRSSTGKKTAAAQRQSKFFKVMENEDDDSNSTEDGKVDASK